jgi:hypothetical protein
VRAHILLPQYTAIIGGDIVLHASDSSVTSCKAHSEAALVAARATNMNLLSPTACSRPITVYRLGEMAIQSCGQRVSAPRGSGRQVECPNRVAGSARRGKQYTEIGLFQLAPLHRGGPRRPEPRRGRVRAGR